MCSEAFRYCKLRERKKKTQLNVTECASISGRAPAFIEVRSLSRDERDSKSEKALFLQYVNKPYAELRFFLPSLALYLPTHVLPKHAQHKIYGLKPKVMHHSMQNTHTHKQIKIASRMS